MNAASGPGRVVISDEVIAPDDLAARLAVAHADVQVHSPVEPSGSSEAAVVRARRLHRLWDTVAPPVIELHPGRRGRATFIAKRVVRKVGAWYVEPRWHGQREIDAEIARFASDSAAAIEQLESRVQYLEVWNDRLQRELRRSQIAQPTRRDRRPTEPEDQS